MFLKLRKSVCIKCSLFVLFMNLLVNLFYLIVNMRAIRFTNNVVICTGVGCFYTLHRQSGNRYAIMFHSKPVVNLYRFPNYSAAALCYAQFMKNAERRACIYSQTEEGNKLLFEYYRTTQNVK